MSLLFLSFLIVGAVGCTSQVESTTAHPYLEGEAVFRGLVFGEGRIADELPEIWANVDRNADPDKQALADQGKVKLIEALRAADATFFKRFGDAIQSGNHLRIDRALQESAALVKEVTSWQSAPKVADSTQTCVAITLVAVGNVAAVVNLVVTANAVYDINWFWGGDGENAWSGTQLGHDQVVDMIATRLFAIAPISK